MRLEYAFSIDARHHGAGNVRFAWHPRSAFVASTGSSKVVHVCDRRGVLTHQVVLPAQGMCSALEWDADGSTLAAAQEGSATIVLWDLASNSTRFLDTGVKELPLLSWAPQGCRLAIGAGKGALYVYDHIVGSRLERQLPCRGRVLCGAWTTDGRLMVVSNSRTLYLYSALGEVEATLPLPRDARSILPSRPRERQPPPIITAAINLGGRSVLLYRCEDNWTRELTFQRKYGHLVALDWVDPVHLLVAFSSGCIVTVSTRAEELGRESSGAQLHDSDLRSVSVGVGHRHLASCGSGMLKIVLLPPAGRVPVVVEEEAAPDVQCVQWSPDARFLAASARDGSLFVLRTVQEREHARSGSTTRTLASPLFTITPVPFFVSLATVIVGLVVMGSAAWGVSPAEVLGVVFGLCTVL